MIKHLSQIISSFTICLTTLLFFSNCAKKPLKNISSSDLKDFNNQSGQLIIHEAKICQSILNLNCQDLDFEQVAKLDRIFAFTKVGYKNQKESFVYHVWIFENAPVASVKLHIKGGLYRTYSSKKITKAMKGQWSFQVKDDENNTVYSKSFFIQ